MLVRHIPLLEQQRRLLDLPRGIERFHRYLDELRGGTDDVALPLQSFNPMSKSHVADFLDRALVLQFEEVAEAAVVEAKRRVSSRTASN